MGQYPKLGLQDPLEYLPHRTVDQLAKGSLVYDQKCPCRRLYLVLHGRVKVISTATDGLVTVGRIICDEGMFGEASLVGVESAESAVTLDDTSIMSWTRDEVENQIEREPRLGLALSQFLVRQCLELQSRIESMAIHKTPERVTLALLQLANAVGKPNGDGSVRIGSLTHQTLAEYVGTSREIVSFQLNRLRRTGAINYSRRFIDVNRQALERALQQAHIPIDSDRNGGARGAIGVA